ncbi:MAG: hypothetical protein IKQ78_00790 [Bacilli bacterium]|nr:hypothetical protein [Bacilli bacterium]
MGRARIQRIWTIGAMTMASLIAVTIGFSAYVTAAVFNKTKNLEPTGGEVALRSYFQKGSGTDLDPFVISRPIHFYNLSRLQNLGVFSTKTHFVLGYDPNHPDDIFGQNQDTDLTFYKDNSSSDLVQDHTLDMNPIYSLTDSIASIGDECAPFCGDFNGQGLAIKNLKISSKPEDVGVFGYTAPGSIVHDVYLINPTVTDDGYETNTEIAPIFANPSLYGGTVTWNDDQSAHTDGSEPLTLTSSFDNVEVPFDNSNPRVNITATLPNLPQSMSSITCEYRLSSPLVTLPQGDGGTFDNLVFHKEMVTKGDPKYDADYQAFANCPDGGTFHVRLSLVASSITNTGIHYSKTIASYLIVLIKHIGQNDAVSFSYQVIKDQFDGETNGLTQYRHGANIGLLCGHAEGSFSSCFVYGGTISLNNQKSGVTSLVQESETGLFGELGASVDSSISPQKNYEGDKDTGVLNFSKMYEDIAGGTHTQIASGSKVYYKYNPGDHEERFVATGLSNEFHLAYEPTSMESVKNGNSNLAYTRDGQILTISGDTLSEGTVVTVYYKSNSADKYKAYLRNNHLTGNNLYYATGYENSLDFTGQKIIEDTETDKRKGMGVFSLVTTATQSDDNSTFAMNELGDYVVKRDTSKTYTDFYYTTAEWNADPDGDGVFDYEDIRDTDSNNKNNVWNDITGSKYHINQPYSFPSAITPKTWNPYFERYFNYNIHCQLLPNSTTKNYFSNTQSEFLKSYFTYKLVNSSGEPPIWDTPAFGVFVRDINPDTGAESAITKFDSVLEVSEEPSKQFTSLTGSYEEKFTGTGKDKEFDLKHIPISTPTITIDEEPNNNFTYENNIITFGTAPAEGAQIIVDYNYKNPTKSVVFSIKNAGGANVTIFAASNAETESYVGIYNTKRPDLYTGDNVTSKPDYAMYCPYYPANETLNRANFHYYNYNYNGGDTPMEAVEAQNPQEDRLYAHTFYLKQGEYIVSSPEGKAQLVYLCAQGQNGKGNTGLSQPNGVNAITNVDFIGVNIDPTGLNIDQNGNVLDGSTNVRCYFSFNSIWDEVATQTPGNNDLRMVTGMSGGKPTIDITAGNNLTYLLADNEGRYSCSLNGTLFERQFYEYTRPSA